MEKKYIFKFWFEYGGGMIWAASDDYTNTKYFSYVDYHNDLPISAKLIAELNALDQEYQGSLDWDYPPDPSPWSKEQFDDFNRRARVALEQLRIELGDEFEILDCLQ